MEGSMPVARTGRTTTTLLESAGGQEREPESTMSGSFRADVRRVDGGVVVRLQGELDVYSAPMLRRAFVDFKHGQGVTVVVDLARLTFMDAAGLGALLTARRDVVARGGQMVLHAPSPAVSRVIQITGIANRFPIARHDA
jgi:anti-sigma B factor antagonist